MFRDLFADMSRTLVGSTKNTLKSYSPFSGYGDGSGFERIAHQGIANLSYRSPILADVAATMLQNFQMEQQKRGALKDYVRSDKSGAMRTDFQSRLGPDASRKEVDSAMLDALKKITGMIDKVGVNSTKQTEEYKSYGKYLEEIFTELKSVDSPSSTSQPQPSSAQTSHVVDEQLNKIEVNTHRTVNTLEEMAMKRDLAGGTGVVGAGAGTGSSGVFIDPLTGLPSIRAAGGAIGGKLLANIFDDETIEKLAKKTKKFFGFETTESSTSSTHKVNPNVSKTVSDIERTVSDIAASKTDSKIDEPIVPGKTKIVKKKDTLQQTFETLLEGLDLDLGGEEIEKAREEELAATKRSEQSNSIAQETLSEIKKLGGHVVAKKDDGKSKIDSILDSVKEKIFGALASRVPILSGALGKLGGIVPKLATAGGSVLKGAMTGAAGLAGYLPKIAGAAGSLGTAAAGALGSAGSAIGAGLTSAAPGLGVAGAGLAGYAAGKYVLNPLINSGIESATGVKGATLGTYLYDMLNPDSGKDLMAPTNVIASKKTLPKQLEQAHAKREEMIAKKESAQTPAPIVLNTNSGTTSSSKQTNMIAPISIRNQDSTFERVQMQNFWSRSF